MAQIAEQREAQRNEPQQKEVAAHGKKKSEPYI